jgi:tetratricopeptide (TPR) repeat protein
VTVVSAVTMIVGLSLLSTAWWLRPIGAAERALASGDLERAAQQYGVSRRRLDRPIFAKSLVPALADLVTGNELSLQYSLRRYDRVLEITAGSDTAPGPASFWAGCALFDRALVQDDADGKLGMMSDAHQAFRRALEADPSDWDARFNYEMTGRLLSILRDQPHASTEEIIKLLRERGPQPRGGRRTG